MRAKLPHTSLHDETTRTALTAHTPAELRANLGARVGVHFELPTREDLRDHPVELDVIITLIIRALIGIEIPTSSPLISHTVS